MFVPMVVMSGHLSHGVWAFCVRCQTLYSFLFSILFSFWCPSMMIDGHASSDWLLGLMPINVCWFSCLSHLGSLGGVPSYWFVMPCVWHMMYVSWWDHLQCFLFLVSFFLVYDNRRRDFIIILSQQLPAQSLTMSIGLDNLLLSLDHLWLLASCFCTHKVLLSQLMAGLQGA